MRIAIYSPYLDTTGGGEKYILTIAEALSKKEDVEILLDKHLQSINIKEVVNKISLLHGLDLSKVDLVSSPIGMGGSFFKKLFFLRKYDWLFYLTDGSIFLSTAKNSVLHFQVPLENYAAKTSWGKFKLSTWQKIIYNSNFTKEHIEQTWPIRGKVIYPPVSVSQLKPLKKKKQILSVGRFFGYLKDKKHSLLIDAFKDLRKENSLKEWSLHLAGGASKGDGDYLKQLKDEAVGFQIFFHPNISLKDLIKLYGESTIYWHAAGFGETDPAKMEHFGIATVEAMAAGCVPIVINLGGQKEVVEGSRSGFLWDSLSDLKALTVRVIGGKKLSISLSKAAQKRAQMFSKEKFINEIYNLVYGKH